MHAARVVIVLVVFVMAVTVHLRPQLKQVTPDARASRVGRHHTARLAQASPEGQLAVAARLECRAAAGTDLPVEGRTHLAWHLGVLEQRLEQHVDVVELLGGCLDKGALFGGLEGPLGIISVHLAGTVPVTFVACDHHGDGLNPVAAFCLHDLFAKTLHLTEGVLVVNAVDQDEHIP